MHETPISDSEASIILDMSESEWRDHVDIQDGKDSGCDLPGVELRLEWENPRVAIIYHFWLSPNLRGHGLGTAVLDEALAQLRAIPRIKSVSTSIQASGGATAHLLQKVGFDKTVTYDHEDYEEDIVEGQRDVSGEN